jgi:phosphoribosyl 1,2-cyclic phosphodiesterase/DNA-binding response OmpR family regulator
MQVRFWGTRGSIAKAGPTTARYGGNTSCIEVRSNRGTIVVIDCGTGAHGLGQALAQEGVKRGTLLIGHTHWDHIQGLPFFAPLFRRDNEWDVCGPKGLNKSLRDTLAGQMESTYFPIALEALGATIHYWDLVEGSFDIDDIRVTTHYMNHPALTLAYKLEVDGATMVYACDHEGFSHRSSDGESPLTGGDLRHAEFISGADLLIHDSQYTAAEYGEKRNWGHSTVEYAMAVARHAHVAQLALTHHDPARTDDELDVIVDRSRATMKAKGSSIHVFAAKEGQRIDLARSAFTPPPVLADGTSAKHPVDEAAIEHTVLLSLHDPQLTGLFADVIAADGSIRAIHLATRNQARAALAEGRPSVAILEHGPDHDAVALARTIAEANGRRRVPIVAISDKPYSTNGESLIAEWLVTPFTPAYAEAKIHAYLLRGTSRWKKAELPADEDKRLASLYATHLLDTDEDPRFERITRLARRVFDMPVALISLVDRDRQWFKSHPGIELSETPREMSFCAHTIFQRETLIIADALADDRFAENPTVTGEPRVRFYAGAPLVLSDGSAIGALCIMDTRPRSLDTTELQMLEDLRDLVVDEIVRGARV